MMPAFFITPFSFSLLFLLLLLLGESSLRWYVLGIPSVLLLLFFQKLDFSWVTRQKNILIAWAAFFCLLCASFLTSHSIPIALETLSFYGFSFLVFVTALSIRFSEPEKEQLAFYSVFIGVVFSSLSLFFLLYPDLAARLPSMNLLYPTFGHNHLAALLLLILPLAWRQVVLAEYASPIQRRVALFFAVFLAVSLLISFGRTALFLGGVQFGFLWFFSLRRLSDISLRVLLKKIFFILVAGLAVFLAVKAYFSYQAATDEQFSCPLSGWFVDRVCKPFHKELRPLYFGQAIRAIQEYPWLGYGPGTFQLISKKYKQVPHADTSLAHNHFLQIGAESGIPAAAAFSLLTIFLFWQTGKKAFAAERRKASAFSFDQAVYVGAFTLLANALWDFDWSYLGLFSLSLFFLGLVAREQRPHHIQGTHARFVAFFSRLIAALLVVLAALYVATEIFLRIGRVETAFRVFPYFVDHLRIFSDNRADFSVEEHGKLFSLYRFHSDAPFFKDVSDESALSQLKTSLVFIDPWRIIQGNAVQSYLDAGDYQTADFHLTQILPVVENAERRFSYDLGFAKKFVLAQQRLEVADFFFQQGDSRKTAEYYLWVRSVEPWIFDHRLPPISEETPTETLEAYLLGVAEIDPLLWGRNYNAFFDWHTRVFLDFLERGDNQKAQFWFDFIVRRFEQKEWILWELASERLEELAANDLVEKNTSAAESRRELWISLWKRAFEESERNNPDASLLRDQ